MKATDAAVEVPENSNQSQITSDANITHNPNGAIVERIALRHSTLSKLGIINVVFRVTHVPGAPHMVFFIPCDVHGGCLAQPIPDEPRSALIQAGEIITISNTSPDMTQRRWTPPPDAGL